METDGSGAIVSPPVPVVNVTRCSGCGRCVAACPVNIVTLEVAGYRKYAAISREEFCTRCRRCVQNCPVDAFES